MRPILVVCACITITFAGASFVACGSDGGVQFGECSHEGRACDITCDDEVGCAACGGDGDCGAGAPFCIAGKCELCAETSDCGAGQACFPRDHQCKPACTSNGGCDKDEPLCDTDSGACVGCLDDQSCGGSEPICNPITRRCGECASSSDCGAAKPVCDVAEGKCRECLLDSQCDGGVCKGHDCKSICEDDDDCADPARARCQESTGECVACLVAGDCPAAAPLCNGGGRCVPCLTDIDCTAPGFPACDGGERCVACTDDVHCAPGLKCKGKQCRE